jgi:hypothetical protein
MTKIIQSHNWGRRRNRLRKDRRGITSSYGCGSRATYRPIYNKHRRKTPEWGALHRAWVGYAPYKTLTLIIENTPWAQIYRGGHNESMVRIPSHSHQICYRYFIWYNYPAEEKQTTYTSVSHPTEPDSLVYHFIGLHLIIKNVYPRCDCRASSSTKGVTLCQIQNGAKIKRSSKTISQLIGQVFGLR